MDGLYKMSMKALLSSWGCPMLGCWGSFPTFCR